MLPAVVPQSTVEPAPPEKQPEPTTVRVDFGDEEPIPTFPPALTSK